MTAAALRALRVTLTAAGHVLASALESIVHVSEESHRPRLEIKRTYGASFQS